MPVAKESWRSRPILSHHHQHGQDVQCISQHHQHGQDEAPVSFVGVCGLCEQILSVIGKQNTKDNALQARIQKELLSL